MKKCKVCSTLFIPHSRCNICSLKCKLIFFSSPLSNGCILWNGAQCGPYGKLKWKQKTLLSHRISYEIFKGPIPPSFKVCHKCDNPLCINPNHLWVGTQKENIYDAIKKKRFIPRTYQWNEEQRLRMKGNKRGEKKNGEKSGLNKLFDSDIYEIRRLLREGVSQTYIAKMFNVTSSTISLIKSRKRWKHLN